MNYIQNVVRFAAVSILALFLFGQPEPGYAEQAEVEQFSCANVTEIPQSECEALVAIYNASISRPSNWLGTTTPCSWDYITCESGHTAKLNLKYNQLRSLPAEIGNFTNLTTLNLYSNQLSSLPAEIGNLTNLTEIDLISNELSSLPAEIGNLTNLTLLYLSGNQLSSLPTEIGNLTNLTELYLFSNHLSNLPAEIGNLTNLTLLYLYFNQLSSLPAEIGNLTNLTGLDLRYNQLSSLPAEIGNLTNLTWLELYSNELSSLPAEIGNLTNLTRLYLKYNQLSSLPTEIGNLTNLTRLYLTSNQLSSLPSEIGNLTNLTELDLGYNRLVIPDDLHSFITEHGADWLDTQTVAPTNVEATVLDNDSIELTWIPIIFQGEGGYYEISVADNGSFRVHGTTLSKSDIRYVIDGLTSGTIYDIRIRTYTPAHDDQPNELWSDYSPVISAATPLNVPSTPTGQEGEGEPSENILFLPVIHR